MSQHVPPSRPTPGGPGDRNFPGELNRPAAPHVLAGVPNAGTAPRSGRVADEAFIRALYAEHGGALLRYALHLTGGDRQRAEDLVQETIVRGGGAPRGRGRPPPPPRASSPSRAPWGWTPPAPASRDRTKSARRCLRRSRS